MKLSGHEKSLADAGQESHAVDAVVNRTGCDVRFARHHVTRYLEKRADGIAVEIESVTDRFAEIGEYAKLRRAIRGLCARAAKEGFAGHKPERVLERAYWVLKRGDRYASSGHTRLGNIVGWTPLRSLADEFTCRSDAFDERTEDMETLGFKVVRVMVWAKVKK